MADTRNVITSVAILVAVVAAGWAIYTSRHATSAAAAPARPAGAAQGAPAQRGTMAPVSVVTAEVAPRQIAVELKAIGTALANESVSITSKTSNLVTAVRFQDGQDVKSGQVLIELDAAQARADLAAANAALTESESLYKRSRELMSTQALSQAQYDQLEATLKANRARVDAAQSHVNDTVIRAPFGGRVGLRRVSVGSLVSPGAVITTLDDTSVIKVDFAVPEIYSATMRQGLPITATTTAWPEREFAGRVQSVDSRIDPTTRSITVRAVVPNADGALKPGMYMNVSIAKDEREALVIPEQALVPEQSRQYVFVVEGGQVSRREVQIGQRQPGRVEIVGGLAKGERIVVEGTQKVREGSAVTEASQSAIPAS